MFEDLSGNGKGVELSGTRLGVMFGMKRKYAPAPTVSTISSTIPSPPPSPPPPPIGVYRDYAVILRGF